MNEHEQPGMMIYFDIIDPVESLTDEELGKLIRAALYYGRDGTEPNFGSCKILNVVWGFMQSKIMRDKTTYQTKREQSRKAAMIRWHGKQEDADACDPVQTMPTTTATAAATAAATATPTAASAAIPAANSYANSYSNAYAYETQRKTNLHANAYTCQTQTKPYSASADSMTFPSDTIEDRERMKQEAIEKFDYAIAHR